MLARLLQLVGLIVVVVLLLMYFDSSEHEECMDNAVDKLESLAPRSIPNDVLRAQAYEYCRIKNR